MSDDARPWEPPLAGTEVAHLVGSLERLRTTFRWKADGLDAAGLAVRIGASSLTIGGLLKHLAAVEDEIFTWRMRGTRPHVPWVELAAGGDPFEWPFTSAAQDAPEDLYGIYDDAVERARGLLSAALEEGGLDQDVHMGVPNGPHANLRRLLCDLLEEYGRHTGHTDLLREAVDGRVGEDPPDGWRPVSGRFRLPGA